MYGKRNYQFAKIMFIHGTSNIIIENMIIIFMIKMIQKTFPMII